MIHSAVNGNFQPLAAQAQMNIENLGQMIAYGMHNSVVCTEDVPFYNDAEIDADKLTKSYMGEGMYRALQATCEVWPAGPIDEDFKQPFSTEVPVLVLSGEADPITPPANGEQATAYLGNALHIVVPGQGHGQAPIGCVPGLMAKFVENAAFEELDTECINRQQASPFFTSFSGPEP
jgi:pimeloyl-ACP methyl ester carboxylesterase